LPAALDVAGPRKNIEQWAGGFNARPTLRIFRRLAFRKDYSGEGMPMSQGEIYEGEGEEDGRKWARQANIEQLREVDEVFTSVMPGLREGDSSALDRWNSLWSRLCGDVRNENVDSVFYRIRFGSKAYREGFVAGVREVLRERTKA
jgi:hypothetical protein